eukprot:TRINITY_DN12621_c0_g1_i1.p1 TRINITY_DN12621_c0_g1~~TRINITY_DN12621_c0_g1_i1.p1  ORF type:complete len:160 (+),score=37.33 TRINITY_DN12621_c0_g1_i1:120-599(+)
MTNVALKEFYARMVSTPIGFLEAFLFQMEAPISPHKVWHTYIMYPTLRRFRAFNSFSHLKREGIAPMLRTQIIVRGQAFDMKQYKRSGVVLRKQEVKRIREVSKRFPECIPFKLWVDGENILLIKPKKRALQINSMSTICLWFQPVSYTHLTLPTNREV